MTSKSIAPIVNEGAASEVRKPWSAPQIIVSNVRKRTAKVHSGFGYEYHETGTTNAS